MSVGYESGGLKADIGSTPLGFGQADVTGGVRYRMPINDQLTMAVDLSRYETRIFAEIVDATYEAQLALGREINPKVFSAAEFASAADGPFLRDVLAKPKIFLLGDERELEELGRRQP